MTKKRLIFIPATLIIIAAGLYLFANYRLKSIVDLRISDLIVNGDYQALNYDSVGFTLNGDIQMRDLQVIDNENFEYSLTSVRITEFDYFNDAPHTLSLSASGLRFPGGLPVFGNAVNSPLNNYLATHMDGDKLALDLNYQYDYFPENNSQLNSLISIKLPDSFNLLIEWEMTNVPMEVFQGNSTGNAVNPENSSMVSILLQNSDLPSASIALQDMGIVDGMLTSQGQELGINSDEYRLELLTQLQTATLFIPQQLQPLAQNFLGRFTEFLAGNSTFNLMVNPEYGGNLQQLQGEIVGAFYIADINRITELLNLEMETVPSI